MGSVMGAVIAPVMGACAHVCAGGPMDPIMALVGPVFALRFRRFLGPSLIHSRRQGATYRRAHRRLALFGQLPLQNDQVAPAP